MGPKGMQNTRVLKMRKTLPSLLLAAAVFICARPAIAQSPSGNYTLEDGSTLLLNCSKSTALLLIARENDRRFGFFYDSGKARITSIQTFQQGQEERKVTSLCRGADAILPPFPIDDLCATSGPSQRTAIDQRMMKYLQEITPPLEALCSD